MSDIDIDEFFGNLDRNQLIDLCRMHIKQCRLEILEKYEARRLAEHLLFLAKMYRNKLPLHGADYPDIEESFPRLPWNVRCKTCNGTGAKKGIDCPACFPWEGEK